MNNVSLTFFLATVHTDFVYVFFGFLFKIAPTLGVSPWNSLQVHCVTVSLAQLDPIIDTRELYGSHFYSRRGVKLNFLLLYSNATKNEKCRARVREVRNSSLSRKVRIKTGI